MFTVYGIYEVGGDTPLYIGRTSYPLKKRMQAHVSTGVCYYLKPLNSMSSTVRLYSYWMFKHAAGVVSLEIRPIVVEGRYWESAQEERRLIMEHKPILNTQCIRPSRYNMKVRAMIDQSIREIRKQAA